MRVLVVDIGGTSVKILATGQDTPRKFPSGKTLTPATMVDGVKELAGDWKYDAVAIGYPGRVLGGRITLEPKNLGRGWVGFDFTPAFGCPVQVMNDAAMQALGSYKSGLLLFLGLGTGLGAALVVNDIVIPMELAHLSIKNRTYEEYLGARALERLGRKKWQKHVDLATARMIDALHPDDIVLGGGNSKKLKKLPKGCRLGDNSYAFLGGFRLFENGSNRRQPTPSKSGPGRRDNRPDLQVASL
jgi:polyphosphate glucokinase